MESGNSTLDHKSDAANMAFARVAMTIAADRWRICQILPPLIKHEAIVTFGQELGRLPLNGHTLFV
uniref:Uncharacterized protein n=1 Tax=Romanomermis culicivorax TaxID=13658 RepID=A0A915KCN4_ROMCU